ncbi:alpha/beta-hydrolase [Coemansia reversa NRRL 1564]|uniref:Alpha/beta-hydrolase n=1 Tax=Coemansia reversa (strain ATCC 12441 / NRRL 1564) TaxID=763665 RepID=A0A2G5BB51_COERN|nr:alpha/beta-hydrolase [Coemansia reversa NRRL 1564]|eukprot:PIA16230.1 alpha/beta-hydrolase [Coemansia reversa NRRL 1564]
MTTNHPDNNTEPTTKTTVDGVEEETAWVEHGSRQFYTHLFKSTQQPPLATLTLIHGLGEHIDRYEDMARVFARSGIQVLGFDQRGFGKTGRRCGRLGDNEGIDTVSSDIGFITGKVRQEGIPHFIMGHSMGGLNALNYSMYCNQDSHVKGVIASAPALLPGKPLLPPNFIVSLLHTVARFVPSIQKNTGITTDMLTSNQAELDRFNASVENIGHCTLGTLSAILKRGPQIIANASKFNTPVFLVHSTGDKATNYEGSRQFYNNLPASLDKKYEEIENEYHELHFEEDIGPALIDSYKQWILERLK